jgi:hypothetical protein
MSTPVLAGKEVRTGPATVRPYLLGGLAALSVGAAAVHFAVVFEHFAEYTLYGVFFLVISWGQIIWPAILLWRPSRLWLWLGIAGNAIVIAMYVASRTVGLPFGPDLHHAESAGALDVVGCVLEFGLIVGCAAVHRVVGARSRSELLDIWAGGTAIRGAPQLGEEAVRPKRTIEESGMHTPLHFQHIAHRGACGKTRVVPHNHWPGPNVRRRGSRSACAVSDARVARRCRTAGGTRVRLRALTAEVRVCVPPGRRLSRMTVACRLRSELTT